MKTIISLIFFFQVFLLAAQDFNYTQDLTSSTLVRSIDYRDPSIEGSPYMQENFEKGILLSNNKKDTLSFKYNAVGDFMEVLITGKVRYILPTKNFPLEVHLLGSKKMYKSFQFQKKKETVYGFFRLINATQKMSLLVKEEITFQKAEKPKTGYDQFKPAKFKRKSDVFFINFSNNDIALEVPRRTKDFLKLFGDHSGKIKTYISKERLKIKNEEDLLKIINYYSQL